MNSEDIIFHSFKINEGYKSEEWGVGENELLFSILGIINGHVCLPELAVTWIFIPFYSPLNENWNNLVSTTKSFIPAPFKALV